jgi:hypothetical protein
MQQRSAHHMILQDRDFGSFCGGIRTAETDIVVDISPFGSQRRRKDIHSLPPDFGRKECGCGGKKVKAWKGFYNAAAEEDGEEQSMPRIRRHFDVVKKAEEKDRHIRAR